MRIPALIPESCRGTIQREWRASPFEAPRPNEPVAVKCSPTKAGVAPQDEDHRSRHLIHLIH